VFSFDDLSAMDTTYCGRLRQMDTPLENLDRMVDGDAPKDKIRSQIRLIGREIAALVANYASLAQAHQEFCVGFEERISKFQERDKQAMRQYFDEQNKKAEEIRKRHTLNY
jgi:hypothetical protein